MYPQEGPRWSTAYDAPAAKKDPFEPLRKNALKIAIVAAIAVALYWYFFLNAKPASLSVSVIEMDGSAKPDGELQVRVAGVTKTVTVNGGSAELTGLPAGRATIKFTPSDDKKYKQTELPEPVVLQSGAEGSANVYVPLNADLKLSLSSQDISAGKGCSIPLRASVTNSGSSAFDAAIVADGNVNGWVTAGNRTIGAGNTGVLDLTVNVPSSLQDNSAKSGMLRVKGTAEGASITITPTEKPTVSFDPADLTLALSVGESKSVPITAKNGGESGLSGITAMPGGDIADWLSITPPKELKAGSSAPMAVRIKVPVDAEAKGYTGVIEVTTPCGTVPISVTADVQNTMPLELSPERITLDATPGKTVKGEISIRAIRAVKGITFGVLGLDIAGIVTLSDSTLDLNAGETYTVFVTAAVPGDASAGDYRGRIQIEFSGNRRSIPVAVTVQPA